MTTSKERLFAEIAKESSPHRSAFGRARLLIACSVLLLSLTGLWALGGVGMTGRTRELVFGVSVIWAGLLFVHQARLREKRSMLGAPTERLIASTCGLPVFLFLAWMIVDGMWPGTLRIGGLPQHLVCLGLSFALSAAPAFGLAYLYRGSDPVHPRALGAALGASAGASGAVLLHIHCPLSSSAHVLVGHVAVTALVAVLFALAGQRLFGLRH